jgi:NtrC-family two-component system sensor histidine kinase KinB
VEGQARAQGIVVSNQLGGELPRLVADPLRLRAVFDNILSNSLKYTPTGGTVTVESRVVPATDARADTVSISVTDTGPGIPSAFRSRIFDKFFRLEHHHTETRPGARGAGIGLYMCRQIVELHGGTIACGAGSGGHGTRITVTLAAAPRSADVADEAAQYAGRRQELSCRVV